MIVLLAMAGFVAMTLVGPRCDGEASTCFLMFDGVMVCLCKINLYVRSLVKTCGM